jgi:hypothetical protein
MDDLITYLKDELFLQLLRHCEQEHILRIWMMGQATAEEPYLLAMSLADLLGTELADWNIKIFATFRQEEATAAARRFTFSEEQLAQLPALYQQQFFERVAAHMPSRSRYATWLSLAFMICSTILRWLICTCCLVNMCSILSPFLCRRHCSAASLPPLRAVASCYLAPMLLCNRIHMSMSL